MENKEKSGDKIVIDAGSAVLGRIASFAAKQALLGKRIVIVNCKDALLTGRRESVLREYHEMRKKGGSALKGPFFPRHPKRIMRRTIRGMLSYKQGRGRDAFNRIICYDNIPKEYENMKKIRLARELKTKAITINELSKEI